MKLTEPYRVIDAEQALDDGALTAMLARDGQTLLPILDLILHGRAVVDDVIDVIGRSTIQGLLEVSAREQAGPPHPGKPDPAPGRGRILRFGYQEGVVGLSDRALRVRKPRLRTKGSPGAPGHEVPVPAYQRLRENPRAGEQIAHLLASGVSTRDYKTAIKAMAGTLGVSKSAVSREFIERTETAHDELMARRFDGVNILVILLDGKLFGDHHALTALGIDDTGAKHVLGVVHGASENAQAAKELLRGLVERGVKPGLKRLFIVDGSKALRGAIHEVYGSENPVQRCVVHKVRNVQDQLPKERRAYAKMVIAGAVRMEPAKGLARLKAWAQELDESYPQAAASLREGMDELFTVARLGLPDLLAASLRSTNLIESPHGLIGRYTGRVKNWKTAGMVLRWHSAACLDAEKRMKRLRGYKDLDLLEQKLRQGSTELRKAG
jgi:putative transposase